jgi:hypothetical protein
MELRKDTLICIISIIILLIIIVVLLLTNKRPIINNLADNLNYVGQDQGRDVFYSLNRKLNTFSCFTEGFQVLNVKVDDINASKFDVKVDYGPQNGQQRIVKTSFLASANIEKATVTINHDSKPRKIKLTLIDINMLSKSLRLAAGIAIPR